MNFLLSVATERGPNQRSKQQPTIRERYPLGIWKSQLTRRKPSIPRSRLDLPKGVNPSIQMKHIVKIMGMVVAITAFWIALLQTSVVPLTHTWLLPIYLIVSLGCYGLLMVGIGLMQFPTCPQESFLLQQDIVEAKGFLKQRGVDVGSD